MNFFKDVGEPVSYIHCFIPRMQRLHIKKIFPSLCESYQRASKSIIIGFQDESLFIDSGVVAYNKKMHVKSTHGIVHLLIEMIF